MSGVVLDASALLALLLGEPGAERVKAALNDSAICAVNLAEVVSHYAKLGGARRDIESRLRTLPIRVVSADTDLAYEAGRHHAGRRLLCGRADHLDLRPLDVYADAYRASGSDAQSRADARSDEYVPAAEIQNGVLNQFFYIDGSVAPGGDDFGNVSRVYFQTLSYDVANGRLLNNTTWESTFAEPTAMIPVTFGVPAGHDVETIVELSAFAYSSYGVVDYVDYKDTLRVYMTTGTPGFDVVGLSGHDYAPQSAVPEPASWATMLVGFGLAGGVLRRRGGDCHPRRSREAARSGTLDVVLDPSGRRAAVSRRHGRRPPMRQARLCAFDTAPSAGSTCSRPAGSDEQRRVPALASLGGDDNGLVR